MRTYVKRPFSIASYTQMRGVIDFSNASQFNMYEKGYQFLVVVSRPKYIEMLADEDPEVSKALELFCWILEYEFKGLSGIDNISVDPLEFTDNISTLNTIGKVNMPSATEITMNFTERTGTAVTGFIDYYLRGIKDPRTQAKTYHGLIKRGKLAAGFENEVFNLLYMVTDNTMLGLEKAFLFASAWPNNVNFDMFNAEKGNIEKVDVDVTFHCYLIDGDEVDRRALRMLAYINETDAVANANTMNGSSTNAAAVAAEINSYNEYQAVLSSKDYHYQGLDTIDSVYEDAVSELTTSAT